MKCGLHALEHFATGFVVVAGGVEDGFDGVGRRTVVQEAEDGLTVHGVSGSGAQTLQGGAVTFAKQMEGGDAGVGELEVVGKDAGRCAKGVFGSKQEVLVVVGGVRSEQEATAGGVKQRRGGRRGVQGVGRCLAERASEENGAVGLVGEFDESGQGVLQAGDGGGGVDDEQADVELLDGGG